MPRERSVQPFSCNRRNENTAVNTLDIGGISGIRLSSSTTFWKRSGTLCLQTRTFLSEHRLNNAAIQFHMRCPGCVGIFPEGGQAIHAG